MLRIGCIILFAVLANLLSAQSYQKLWDKVEEAQQRDLPRTAIDVVKTIEDKAITEGNTPQEMMALFVKMRLHLELSSDSFELDKKAISLRVQQFKDTAEHAFWTAFLVKTLAESAHVNYDERRQYAQQLVALLADMELFHGIKDKDIAPLVRKGKDAKDFDNDVFHIFLQDCQTMGVLSAQVRSTLYQRAEDFYRSKQLMAAAIRCALNHDDAENVASRYADFPENAIAYATWMEQLYGRIDHNDNAAKHDLYLLAQEGAKRYKSHSDAKRIKALIRNMETPMVSISETDIVCYPNRPMHFVVTANNTRKQTLLLYRCSSDGQQLFELLETHNAQFPKSEPWRTLRDTLHITLTQPGSYKLVAKGFDRKNSAALLTCSRITPFLFYPNNATCRIMALDTQSGDAYTAFSMRKMGGNEVVQQELKTEKGTFWLTPSDINSASFNSGGFQILMLGDSCSEVFYPYLSTYRNYANQQRQQQRVQLFTDRTLYRPGQKVIVGGVMYAQTDDTLLVTADADLTIELLERGNKAVASFQAKTNAFGQFHGEFILPFDKADGYFSIRVSRCSPDNQSSEIVTKGATHITIGAYKRQTFAITLSPITAAYSWGDTIQLAGKVQTMALQPMANALVRYSIAESSPLRKLQNEAIEGVMRTDAQGHFHVSIALNKPKSNTSLWRHFYHRYQVTVSVVGDNGETQTEHVYIPVNEQATTLNFELPKVVCKEQLPTLTFQCTNAMGVKLEETISLNLFDSKGVLAWQQQCPSNLPISFAEWHQLTDGCYSLVAQSSSGETQRRECLIISKKSTSVPHGAPQFFITESGGESTTEKWVVVGTSREHTRLFIDVVSSKGELMCSEQIVLSNEVRCIPISYTSTYGDGATVCFTALTDGVLHQHEVRLQRPSPDLRLNMQWATFRNRLQPGQEELWELRITHPDGTPAEAAVVARLYDASLDALANHDWYVNPYRSPYFSDPRTTIYSRNSVGLSLVKERRNKSERTPDFSQWNNWLSGGNPQILYCLTPKRLGMSMAKGMETEALQGNETVHPQNDVITSLSAAPLALRENFSEVAFMTSALLTDTAGGVALRFTLPEQLTTWRFTAFAHDKSMRHTLMEDTVVAQKMVTVSANVPRFVREGDCMVVPVVVRSLLTDSTRGRFSATFFDADTEAIISRTVGSFITDNGSAAFRISLPALDAQTLKEKGAVMPSTIGCRVMIEGTNFSDGEVHRIPVVSNDVEVVRALPFCVTSESQSAYSLDTLWTDTTMLRAPKVKITFTPSALHEAISALASLTLEPAHSIDDWARRYYALTLTLHLSEKGFSAANFDRSKAINLRDEAATYIKERQLKNGAWAWFEGMRENTFITSEMLQLFARLQTLVGAHPLTPEANKAMKFMHAEMEEVRKNMVNEKHEIPLSTLPLRYLETCCELNADTTAAYRYFLDIATKNHAVYALRDKAVISKVLRKNGQTAHADLLLKSLREHLIQTPEMGAYFESYKAQLTHDAYRIPTQTAAIEAFHHAGDLATVGRMQQWLLQSKRTQQWETTRATADAVYALCLKGNTVSDNSTNEVISHVSSDTIFNGVFHTLNIETCDSAKQTEVRSNGDTITLLRQKTTNSPQISDFSYGSVRAFYSLPLALVKRYDSGLSIDLHLEIKRNGVWEKVGNDTLIDATLPLRQVARVQATRDFDFVELTIPRPACCEPTHQLSGYSWQQDKGCYRVATDQEVLLFVDKLPKGSHTFIENLYTERAGSYEQGIGSITCTYAPEFSGNTANFTLQVK